jgi:hypothetical protein
VADGAWESGGRSLAEGWAQAQDFWSGVARSWGEAVGLWVGQPPWAQRRESVTPLREVHEAAVAVVQAWLRLPLALTGPAVILDFQRALLRLAEANARLYLPPRPPDGRG